MQHISRFSPSPLLFLFGKIRYAKAAAAVVFAAQRVVTRIPGQSHHRHKEDSGGSKYCHFRKKAGVDAYNASPSGFNALLCLFFIMHGAHSSYVICP